MSSTYRPQYDEAYNAEAGAGMAAPQYSFVQPDTMFSSQRIFKLSVLNFKRFVKLHEKTLVMFYNSDEPRCPVVEQRFTEVANRSRNEKYGFASVDCGTDRPVCIRYSGCETPMLKLYSNGHEVSSIKDPMHMNVDQINMLIKMTPVLHEARGDVGRYIAIKSSEATPSIEKPQQEKPKKSKFKIFG